MLSICRQTHQRTDRRATIRRRDVKGILRTRNARGNPSHRCARRTKEPSRSSCDALGVLDDEVCHGQRELIERRLGAPFLKRARILVRKRDNDHFVGRKALRRASSIALTGSESPTWDSTSSLGAASATSSARVVASVRASPSAFVSQSSREMPEAALPPHCRGCRSRTARATESGDTAAAIN